MDRKNKLREIVSHLYHKHDLGIRQNKEKIEALTEKTWKEIKDFPEIKPTEYLVTQVLLES